MCVYPPDVGPVRDASVGLDVPTSIDGGAACVVAGGLDTDGDGYCADTDCDDGDRTVHPGAEEVCSPQAGPRRAIDENCDGAIDEGCAWHFGEPHWTPWLATTYVPGSPMLRGDGLRLYMRGGVGTDSRLLVAERPDVASPFGRPTAVAGPDAGHQVVGTGVAISADELSLVFQLADDLWASSRPTRTAAFGAASAVSSLNSPMAEIHPALRDDGLEMVFASGRVDPAVYRLYSSTRPTLADDWGPPEAIVLGTTTFADSLSSPTLSMDGLTLFFTVDAPTGREIYSTRRPSRDVVRFGDPAAVAGLRSSTGANLYLSVSERTGEAFFQSTRDWYVGRGGGIWRVRVCRDAPCTPVELTCPPGAEYSPGGLHCYWLVPATQPWGNARSACGSAGHLATIHSAGENALLVSLLRSATRAWVGGYDGTHPGLPTVPQCSITMPGCVFAWVTEEPWTYANWGADQPNNIDSSGMTEDTAAIEATRWVDTFDSSHLPSLCEAETWPAW